MPHPNLLELACPAKVNLALSVGTPRDDGMHPLASWMVAIDFADALTLEKLRHGISRFEISPTTDGAATDRTVGPRVSVDWPVDHDLAYRAHALMETRIGRALPVDLNIRKVIPAGAGLGGGSSNAAATLVGLNRLFGLGIPHTALIAMGQELGSDVSFLISAILGAPSALVTGFGEQLESVDQTSKLHLVLVFPGFSCPTGPVYAALDRLRHSTACPTPDAKRVRTLAGQPKLTPEAPFNDLTQAAYDVRPELKTIVVNLQEQLSVPVHVTGSGSTLYLVAPSHTASIELAKQATASTGLPAIATHT